MLSIVFVAIPGAATYWGEVRNGYIDTPAGEWID
jgi:hypothetical protein